MSCTPDESIESRFVPRRSITSFTIASSSMMEGHFSTPQARTEPSLIDDDKGGIVGATICFTPQPSPAGSRPGSPLMKRSVETEEYIGSIEADQVKNGSLVDDDVHEFELLDGIESKASINVEDLDVDDKLVDDLLKDTAASMKQDLGSHDLALKEMINSPPSSLPSLNEEDATRGKAEAKRPTPLLNGDSLQYSDATPFSRMTKSMLSHMAKLGNQDIAGEEGGASDTPSSPKVDATPISKLKTLKTYWENYIIGKTMEKPEGVNATNPPNESDHLSISNSVVNSHASSGTHSKPYLVATLNFVWLWIQSLVLLCAFSAKKIIEQICNALARNIISTAAGQIGPMENESSDEPGLEEVVGSACLKLDNIFSKSVQEKDSKLFNETDNSANDATTSQGTVVWKSRAALFIALVAFILRMLLKLSAYNTMSSDATDGVCTSTNTTNFDDVSYSEIDLDPTTDTIHLEMNANSIMSRIVVFASIAIALLCAYIYKPKFFKKIMSIKKESKHLTGLWTVQEHEQFIEGFEQYGTNWKLVAPFIPSRTYEQVKAHGIHWRKIGSPDTMKRSKKIEVESPKPVVASSVVSPQRTPKTTNITHTGIKNDPEEETHSTKTKIKSRGEQLASARAYAKNLKKTQSAKKKNETKTKRSSRHSL